jgi:transcriptional regulator with XRE-family HTH domain
MGMSLFMNICRLRKFRKSAQLTQREVAMLVGSASQRAYSDVELGLKRPALGPALGCCILFDASLHDLFPDLAKFVERDVLARARKLKVEFGETLSREAAASHIAGVVSRISGSSTFE